MPTSFVTSTFVMIVTLNNFGELTPVDKSLLPPPMTSAMMWSVDQCRYTIGKMDHPEKYTCQVFTSPKTTTWTPDQKVPMGDIKAEPTSVISPQAVPRAPGEVRPDARAPEA